jgi:hypothetical protein
MAVLMGMGFRPAEKALIRVIAKPPKPMGDGMKARLLSSGAVRLSLRPPG